MDSERRRAQRNEVQRPSTFRNGPRVLLASGIPYALQNGTFCSPWLQLSSYPALLYYRKLRPLNVFGELMAIWTIKEESEKNVQDARSSLLNTAAKTPIKAELFVKVANFIKTKIEEASSEIIVSKECFCNNLGIQPTDEMLDNYPLQKLVWMEVRGNVFGWNKFIANLHPDWLTIVNNLNDIANADYQNIPDFQFRDSNGAFSKLGFILPANIFLGFTETLAMAKADTIRQHVMGAATIAIFSITKDLYVTDMWLKDKISKIESECEGLHLKSVITEHSMKAFLTTYPIGINPNYNIHSIIQAIFTWCDEKSLDATSWMIEDAVISRTANIVFFAEAMTARKLNFLDWLMLKIGTDEFTNLATQIGWILHDRYGAIVKLQVPSKKYSNIVYIGRHTYLRKKQIGIAPKSSDSDLDILVNLINDFNRKVVDEEKFQRVLNKVCKVKAGSFKFDEQSIEAEAMYLLLEKLLEMNGEHKFRALKRSGAIGYDWTSKLSDEIIEALSTLQVMVPTIWNEDYSEYFDITRTDLARFDVMSRMVFQRMKS